MAGRRNYGTLTKDEAFLLASTIGLRSTKNLFKDETGVKQFEYYYNTILRNEKETEAFKSLADKNLVVIKPNERQPGNNITCTMKGVVYLEKVFNIKISRSWELLWR